MNKERLIQCVPIELMDRLKNLLARLWDDKNPAAVHLGAIMDEFETDVKSLSGVVAEYETDCAVRLKLAEEEYREKARAFENDRAEYKARMSGLDKACGENTGKVAELNGILKSKEAELEAFRAQFAEKELQLNSKYVNKMSELYDKVSRKEMEILSRWEEKNKAMEAKYGALEAEHAEKARQIKLREKALEEEFNARKEELVKAFDRVRLDLEARETALSGREKNLAALDKALSAREEKLAALEKKRRTVTDDL
ncbi:MAG: hypothetical protein A2X28_05965 [Elusimicrobia bacterium GWA2_56_46]|jgi:chromosome segregation ATPase|nr:MAG: hypothetical protein A2X28_05965 [Elusimicrobia bacterium GWA2_56_46]OGR54577.1 MAG: hypothetical protein A2X39_02015 [Elusimicrobia bacterium GWC2_56_31]HBB65741.1 hypothetical protein [Elusimicrobiota bacterium]HBW23941.1 hypothetical protein [Elusimicrobiota bacterium]